MDKVQQMTMLIDQLRKETSVGNLIPPLINQFSLHVHIPNKWFDWQNRVNAKIMIIGQDWGPYVSLKKYIDGYNQDPHYSTHTFSSRTEKFIITQLNNLKPGLVDQVFFTMAVLFTRGGTKFRGSENFNEQASFEHSYSYVSRQIDIVEPKVIMTMGKLAFQVVNKKFSLGHEKLNLTQTIDAYKNSGGVITTEKTSIIPNYHPAAHVSPQIQKAIWSKLSAYI